MLGLAAIGAAVVGFVLEVWRLGRDLDEEPTDTLEPDEDELDRLAYDVPMGMPTWLPLSHHYSLLD